MIQENLINVLVRPENVKDLIACVQKSFEKTSGTQDMPNRSLNVDTKSRPKKITDSSISTANYLHISGDYRSSKLQKHF